VIAVDDLGALGAAVAGLAPGALDCHVQMAFNTVTAVGGTTLKLNAADNTRLSETVWSGAGSGCSAYIGKPSWQHDSSCINNRTVADVAAVADPATGVAVYDSYGSHRGNWYVFGGTSVVAPIIGAVLCPVREHRRHHVERSSRRSSRVVVHQRRIAVRRDHRQQRIVRRHLSLHWRKRLRRTNRQWHTQRDRRLLGAARTVRLRR
jgi:hypothetical protein